MQLHTKPCARGCVHTCMCVRTCVCDCECAVVFVFWGRVGLTSELAGATRVGGRSRKPLFASWHPGALEGYLAGGLRPVQPPDGASGGGGGGGVTLCCTPEVEAGFFGSGISERRWAGLRTGPCQRTRGGGGALLAAAITEGKGHPLATSREGAGQCARVMDLDDYSRGAGVLPGCPALVVNGETSAMSHLRCVHSASLPLSSGNQLLCPPANWHPNSAYWITSARSTIGASLAGSLESRW